MTNPAPADYNAHEVAISTNGTRIYVRLTFDGTPHGDGRTWEVGYLDGIVCEKVADAGAVKKFGTLTRSVNWGGWGSQDTETTLRFTAALAYAANLADMEYGRALDRLEG